MPVLPDRPLIRRITRTALWCASILAAVIATIVLLRAFDARGLPDLKPWHTLELAEEYRAGDDDVSTFEDYLALEARLFAELDARVHHQEAPAAEVALDRYDPRSPSFPGRFPVNWNRSIELRPDELRGGALLLHGLTDSPYSFRSVAELLRDQGYYVLVPRLPGHGTIPASLAAAEWRDWTAVVRLAARRVREVIGPDAELLVGGYSNGGTLAVFHTVEMLEEDPGQAPDRLLLLSPAIGVSAAAAFASWHRMLSAIPYFEKFRWLSVRPEYDPFKYNSFPKNAGHASWLLTRELQGRLQRAEAGGKLDGMPPVLVFQSLIDSTVFTESIAGELFERLPEGGHELVLFDLNRLGAIRQFLRERHQSLLQRLTSRADLAYTVTLITNDGTESREVVERRRPPGGELGPGVRLGLFWPEQVYSLSHVAIPFPPGDPLYGDGSGRLDPVTPLLGSFRPRGEEGILIVHMGQFMRLRYNPFFDYIEGRLNGTVRSEKQAG